MKNHASGLKGRNIKKLLNRKFILIFIAGMAMGLVAVVLFQSSLHYTSSSEFCISCHEMRFIAEQGWMESPHYTNDRGVVAGCSDCHVPPEFFPKLWVKSRDGITDIYVHTFGESDPYKMDWDELGKTARSKIYDSACKKCHANLTPAGASMEMLAAHREYGRPGINKKCLDCHDSPFHGEYGRLLADNNPAKVEGEEQ